MARLDVNLADAVRQYDLLGSVELDAFVREIQPRFPEPDAACAELVRRGWLTRFQAGELLGDRGPSLVLGSYVLIDPIGHGGMGQLFKARHRLMRRTVAIKLIKPECLSRSTAIARFLREIHLLARLSHPNVILAHDAEQVDGRYFLVMEYCDGQDLGKLVRTEGPLTVGRACDFIRQAALGLQHAADQGLVHRDIKPENLLVVNGVVKVLDFGLSCLREPDSVAGGSISSPGDFLGTPDYAAPEQANDIQSADIRSDLYCLGGTFYFALTGKPPFPGGGVMDKLFRHQSEEAQPIRLHRPDVPAEVQAIIARLLAKNPAERFPTPAAVALALVPFCELEAVSNNAHRGSTLQVAKNDDTSTDDNLHATTMEYSEKHSADPDRAKTRARRVEKSRFRRMGIMSGLIVSCLVLSGYILTSMTLSMKGERPHDTVNPNPTYPPTVIDPPTFIHPPSPSDPPTLIYPPSSISPPNQWRLKKSLGPMDDRPVNVAYSPSGKQLAITYRHWDSPHQPGLVRIVSIDGDTPARTLAGHKLGPAMIVYSLDGSHLISATGDMNIPIAGEVILWDLATGKPRQTLAAQPGGVNSIAISRTHLATGGQGKTVKVWELSSTGAGDLFEFPTEIEKGVTASICSLDFSPDGQLLAAGGNDGQVRLWNVATQKMIAILRPEQDCGAIVDLRFSPDGDRLVGLTSNAPVNNKPFAILVWKPRDLRPVVPLAMTNNWNFGSVVFVPGTNEILTSDQGGNIRQWNFSQKFFHSELRHPQQNWSSIKLSPNGLTAATVSTDSIVRIWDVTPKSGDKP